MKGLLGVGVAVATSEESGLEGRYAPSSRRRREHDDDEDGSGGGGSGDTSGCPPGTTIKTSGACDADGDELETEPDDNDGCI